MEPTTGFLFFYDRCQKHADKMELSVTVVTDPAQKTDHSCVFQRPMTGKCSPFLMESAGGSAFFRLRDLLSLQLLE